MKIKKTRWFRPWFILSGFKGLNRLVFDIFFPRRAVGLHYNSVFFIAFYPKYKNLEQQLIKLEEIQWTSNIPQHTSKSFCSWLHKTTPVSEFLLERLEQKPNYRLINSGYFQKKKGFFREAIIYNGDISLIYAQTHFPQKLVDEIPQLTQLGDSSLGIFLLEHGQFHKDSMEFGYLKRIELLPAEIQVNPNIKACDSLLCRRSILAIADYKAELLEIFLPSFEELFY